MNTIFVQFIGFILDVFGAWTIPGSTSRNDKPTGVIHGRLVSRRLQGRCPGVTAPATQIQFEMRR